MNRYSKKEKAVEIVKGTNSSRRNYDSSQRQLQDSRLKTKLELEREKIRRQNLRGNPQETNFTGIHVENIPRPEPIKKIGCTLVEHPTHVYYHMWKNR